MATAAEIQATYKAIVRVDLNATTAQAVADAINNGTTTLAVYQAGLVTQSQATTQAALALSSFITGTAPADAAKLDSLTAFAKTQNDYYTNVLKSSNAQLGAYEALGRSYAADATTAASFSARYGALTTAEFVAAAYGQVFTTAPTAAATANLVAQVTYFTNLYTAAGIPADQASLQAKGAVLGQIIGYAATSNDAAAPAPQTTLDNVLATTLNTIANEARTGADSTVYGKALPGVTGQGVTLAVVANDSVSIDSATPALKATVFADTITGTISGTTKDVSINTGAGDDSIGTAASAVTITEAGAFKISVDGSGGNDSLYVKAGSALTANTTIANVEKIFLDGDGKAAAATNWTGVQELWAFKSTGATAVTDISSGVKVGVDSTTQASTFTFKAGVASTDLVLKNAAGAVTVNGTGTDLKTLSVAVDSVSTLTSLSTNAATVNVTGSTNATLGVVTADVKTFNAGAFTGNLTVTLDAKIDTSAYTLGSGADTVTLVLNDQGVASKFTLGAGNDTVKIEIADLANLAAGTVSKFAEITDFTKGADKLQIDVATASDLINVGAIAGQSTLDAAIGVAAGSVTGTGQAIVFEYLNNTYIYHDTAADGLTSGDGLIKLAGVGFTVGTDIVAV